MSESAQPARFLRQAGAIPWRPRDGQLEILLVTNRRHTRWIVPKGMVEPGQTILETAVQEAWEEAGVRGEPAAEPASSYERRRAEVRVYVDLLPLRVTDVGEVWPEMALRRRTWLPVAAALAHLRSPGMQRGVETLWRQLRFARVA